jgi:hypothetical protein
MSAQDPMAVKHNVRWSDSDLAILRDMVRYYKRYRKLDGGGSNLIQTPDTYQGAILAKVSSEDGLPAATSKTKPGRGKIRMRRLWFEDGDTSQEDMEIVGPTDKPLLFQGLSDELLEYTCYNVSETVFYEENDIVAVLPLKDGHFIVVPSGAGIPPKVTTIRFRVDASDPESFTILGFVLAWDGDQNFDRFDIQDDVNGPDMEPLGVVEICDPHGCFFDEPQDELFARTGWARRMYSSEPGHCRTGYPPYKTLWEVFSLCCKRKRCNFV